jgi:hypothetical protein
LRFFEASTNITLLGQRLAELGQLPLFPPNVKGWTGGRTWINASTILARANLISGILTNDKTKFQAGSLENWVSSKSDYDIKHSLDWADEFLLATPLSADTRQSFAQLTKDSQGDVTKMLAFLAALPEFQLN